MRHALLTAILLAGCVDLTLPDGAQVLCTSSDDCPDGFTCTRGGKCVRDGDLVPPELEGALSFSPGRQLRAGQTLTVGLRASEPLARPPEVVLSLSPPVRAACTGEGAAWSCTYTVTGEENDGAGGTVPILVRLVDTSSNESERRDVDTIELDFAAPRVVRANLSRTVLRPGDAVELLVTVTEPLADGATVEAGLAAMPDVSPRVFPLEREEQSLNYVARYTVGTEDPAGEFIVSGVLVDAVGNTGARVELARLRVDPVPLSVATSNVTPRYAGPGAEVVVELELSKTVATQPRVRLGDLILEADQTIVAPAFRFSRTVVDGDPQGTFPIVVEAADDAGRVIAEAVGLVTIDTTRPALRLVRPTPRGAREGTLLSLLVQADEPLSALTATAEGADTFALDAAAGSDGSFERTISADDAEGTYGVRVKLVDLAGNTREELAPDVFTIDRTAPQIGQLVVTPARIAGTGTVTTTFVLDAPLPADAVEVSIAGRPMTCVVAGASWRCTRAQQGNELPAGSESTELVLVRVRDEAGNTASASSGIVFDFRAPALVPGTLAVELEPGVGSPVRTPSALGPGVGLRVAFAVDEPLASQPSLATTPAGISFAPVTATALTFVLRAQPDVATLPEGPLALSVTLVDGAGNTATIPLPTTVTLDHTPPSPPDVETSRRIELVRAPWGRSTGTAPTTVVQGAAGAVAPGTLVIVFDTDGAQRAELGRATGAADGAFGPIVLDRDRRQVWVAAADGAGNVSASLRVRDVTWAATLAGKIAGSTFENPHELQLSTHAVASLRPTRGRTETPTDEVLARIGSVDGTVARIGTGAAWTMRRPRTPPGRRGAVLAHDPVRGRTVMFGGESAEERYSDTWEWDGEQWQEATVEAPPSPRTNASMVWDGTANRVVMFAGYYSLLNGNTSLSELWDWDGTAWHRRTSTNTPPPGRSFAALVWDAARERIVMYGGRDSTRIFDDTWEYDGSGWIQRSIAGPGVRLGHAMAYDPIRRRTVLFGGASGGPALDETWEYDGTAWTRHATTGTRPPPSYCATLTFDPRIGQVVLYAGAQGATFHDARWAWNGVTWTRLDDPTRPDGRWDHAAAFDTTRGELVVFGGSGDLDETWVHGAAGWKRTTPSESSPGRRTSHNLVYDQRRGQMILFGGLSGGTLRSTIEPWDGYAWAPMVFAGTPPSRYDAGMAYDASRGRAYLFGGDTSTGLRKDMWSWNGDAWTSHALLGGPVPLAAPGVTFDAARDQLVVFGGVDDELDVRGETWLWNPQSSSWQAGPAGPPPRAFAPLAYDATRGRTVLFGGAGDLDAKSDTWEWTGTAWVERHPAHTPPGRDSSRLTWDARRERVVLFGGAARAVNFADLWEWDGTDWHERPVHGVAPAARASMGFAYDSTRGRTVMYGGAYADLADEHWELIDDPGQRPAELVTFDVATSGDDGALESLALRVDAGATGTEGGTSVHGVALQVWDPAQGIWREVGLHAAPADAPATLVSTLEHPLGLRRWLRLGRSLHVRIVPRAGQGVGGADVVIDAVELVARFRR